MSTAANPRQYVVSFIFIGVASVILLRLFFLQNFEEKYKILANDIAIYKKVVYPPRGIVVDKKGKVMLSNSVIYDLMVTPRKVPKNLDTAQFCKALGIDKETYESIMRRVLKTNIDVRQSLFMEQLSDEQTARFRENDYMFNGFELLERNIRQYENASAGIVLGYIGEVSPEMLKKPRYNTYHQGDYAGLSGLELQYEEVLRGQRGVHYIERDKFNRPAGPYKGGMLDSQEVAGRSLDLYLDADLQSYAEKLMANKIGSVVAIDPETGGILAMVSSPTYDPNLLRGHDRAKNYAALYLDATRPLFNRAIQAMYPPGSTIKPFTGLIALNLGVIMPSFGFPCLGSYNLCSRPIKCDEKVPGHAANFRLALAHSCNSYFCHVFRMTVDFRNFNSVKEGLQTWHNYMNSFGFGRPTGVDLPFEKGGEVPDTALYNKMYHGSWNSCTVVFVGMGQGELLLTPLQMANGMCIIANKGYYYTPHFVKAIGKNANDSLLKKYHEKHVVLNIPDTTFDIVQRAMQDVVEKGTAAAVRIPGIDVCAKTGTAENKAIVNGEVIKMKSHSMFEAFAPREHPRIAVAVAVENAGYGADWAGPITSLIIEKYLNDSIAGDARKAIEQKMFNANLINKYVYVIDSAQRAHDAEVNEERMERKYEADSAERAEDSAMFFNWVQRQLVIIKKNKKAKFRQMASLRRTLFYRIDGIMLLLYVMLVAVGILAIFSVEHRATDVSIFMMNKSYMKQLVWFGYSLLIGFVILLTESKFFSSFAFLIYTIALAVLVITIFAGVDVKGSKSWLGIGSFRFQPGEIAKIFTAMALAKFLSLPETNFKTLKDRFIAAGIALLPAVLIILQKETGLALVYFTFFLVLYREGLPNAILVIGFSIVAIVLGTLLIDRKILFIIFTVLALLIGLLMRGMLRRSWESRILLIGAWLLCIGFSQVAVPFIFKHVLQKHQIDRIFSTIGKDVPDEYDKSITAGEERTGDEKKVNSSEYNVLQSKIAIGSGGLWGKGFLNGTSTKNQFVPEQNTDFIFCAIGEQFGFVGSALLVALYVAMMLRIVYIAERQRSVFTRVYAYCVASILFFHFAVNISMTIGLMPVIGITLPFLSYGGSSLMAFSILIFILVRLDADRAAIIR